MKRFSVWSIFVNYELVTYFKKNWSDLNRKNYGYWNLEIKRKGWRTAESGWRVTSLTSSGVRPNLHSALLVRGEYFRLAGQAPSTPPCLSSVLSLSPLGLGPCSPNFS